MLYQSPLISTIRQDPFQYQTQYTPDCDGTACSESLGFEDACVPCGPDPDEVSVTFFLAGRTDPTPPFGCIVVAEDCNFDSHDGSGCGYELTSCAEGQVWEVSCSFGNALNNNGGFCGTAEISCDGESADCSQNEE